MWDTPKKVTQVTLSYEGGSLSKDKSEGFILGTSPLGGCRNCGGELFISGFASDRVRPLVLTGSFPFLDVPCGILSCNDVLHMLRYVFSTVRYLKIWIAHRRD